MGRPIAGRLLDGGHRLTVWNRSPGRAGDLVARGARESDSIDSAVRGAGAVVTSLTGDDAVAEVLLPDGSARSSIEGVVVECSTISPSAASRLASAYAGRLVGCPIAGAPPMVARGHATLIVGGPADAVGRAEPVLSSISDTRVHAGDAAERAALVKLLNNYLMLGSLSVLADAAAVGQRFGFDDAFLAALFDRLPVVAPGLKPRIAAVLGHEHDPAFTIDLGAKDLRRFAEASADGGPSALAEVVRACYDGTAELGLGDRDISAVVERFRRRPADQD
jgi:3-hydroxyisobutyrate dehydrogenase